MILMVSLLSRDDPLLPSTASPVIKFDVEPALFMHPVPELPKGYYRYQRFDPLKWLHEYSHIDPTQLPTRQLMSFHASRPKAALISLVKNSDIVAMVHTVSEVEAHFNSKKLHRYDWVLFSNEDFTEEFKAAVLNVTSSHCFFERIPEHHWAVPHWIDSAKFSDARQFLEGHYQKSRWNAGLFALESRLQDYEWYWRIEPGVSSPNPDPAHTRIYPGSPAEIHHVAVLPFQYMLFYMPLLPFTFTASRSTPTYNSRTSYS